MEVLDDQVYIFQAEHASEWSTFTISLILTIAGLIVMGYFLKNSSDYKTRNRNLLIAMLSFFMFMIAGGTSFFSWLTVQKISDVVIDKEKVTTGYGTSEYNKISRVYFHDDVNRSPINPAIQKRYTRFLIIEEIKGKTHALSEEHFKINEIYAKLSEKLE